MLVSGAQQSDSVVPIHGSILFPLLPHLDYCRVVNSLPCTITAGPLFHHFRNSDPAPLHVMDTSAHLWHLLLKRIWGKGYDTVACLEEMGPEQSRVL